MQAGFRLEVHLVGMIQYGLETVPVLNWKQENIGSISIKLLIHFEKTWNNMLHSDVVWGNILLLLSNWECKKNVQNIFTPYQSKYGKQRAAFLYSYGDMDNIFTLGTTSTGPDGRENREKRSFIR